MSARLHESISADLLDQIHDGKLQIGQRIPSTTELREHYGVSHVTVLNAFKQLARDGWIERQDGLGYFVRNHSRSETRAATSSILSLMRPFVHKNPLDIYISTINSTIQAELYKHRYQLIWPHSVSGLLSIPVSPDTNRALIETARDYAGDVNGIILDERIDDPTVTAIRDAVDVPLVLVNRPTELPIPAIAPANETGARRAAEYAVRVGYDTFVVCECNTNLSPTTNLEVRGTAFRNALNDLNVPDDRLHRLGDFLKLDHPRKLSELKSLLESLPSGRKILLFAVTDYIGRSLCDGLIEWGWHPGQDIGLISFDSIGMATMLEPHLTTVDPQPEAIGRLAVETLLNPHALLGPSTREAPFTLAIGDTA